MVWSKDKSNLHLALEQCADHLDFLYTPPRSYQTEEEEAERIECQKEAEKKHAHLTELLRPPVGSLVAILVDSPGVPTKHRLGRVIGRTPQRTKVIVTSQEAGSKDNTSCHYFADKDLFELNPLDDFAHKDLVELDPLPTHEDVRKRKHQNKDRVLSGGRGQSKISSDTTKDGEDLGHAGRRI
jgi:hypothetical protein